MTFFDAEQSMFFVCVMSCTCPPLFWVAGRPAMTRRNLFHTIQTAFLNRLLLIVILL